MLPTKTFTSTGCSRHPLAILPGNLQLQRRSLGRTRSISHGVSAAPAVDIGGNPALVDEEAPPLLTLHERCTEGNQPFLWPSAPEATEEHSRQHATEGALQAQAAAVYSSTTKYASCARVVQSRSDVSSTGPSGSSTASQSTSTQHPSHVNGAGWGDTASGTATLLSHGVTYPAESRSLPVPMAATASSIAASPAVDTNGHCSETHPGSICCTTTAVEKDTTSSSCAVTLRTTVKLTDPRLHVAPCELEELAWLTARDAAAEQVSALNGQCSRLLAGREERHRAVCHMLRYGVIRDAKRNENEFGHVSYLLTLEDKDTGRRMRAAFKPRVAGDCEGWHRVPVEVAAYQLNLLLGMDVVPPAVIRRDCDVDWTHYPEGGAFIYWCGNARQLNSVPLSDWSVPAPVLLGDTRILDVLIQNSDRHIGHFLYAEHWAHGEYLVPAGNAAQPQEQGQQQGQQQKQGQHQSQQQQKKNEQHNQNHQHSSATPKHPYPHQHQGPSAQQQQQQDLQYQHSQPRQGQGQGQQGGAGPHIHHHHHAHHHHHDHELQVQGQQNGSVSGGCSTSDVVSSSLSPPASSPPSSAVWRGRMRPVLIDHAAGFRQDAFVCLAHENAFATGPTRQISAHTYLRLRFLDAPSLRTALAGLVTDDEVVALLGRRDEILAFFDGLVREHGYENVVLAS